MTGNIDHSSFSSNVDQLKFSKGGEHA